MRAKKTLFLVRRLAPNKILCHLCALCGHEKKSFMVLQAHYERVNRAGTRREIFSRFLSKALNANPDSNGHEAN
jgi:hypothetical protein